MMSGHSANPIFFNNNNKKKDWTSRTPPTTLRPITFHFCLTLNYINCYLFRYIFLLAAKTNSKVFMVSNNQIIKSWSAKFSGCISNK